MANPEQSVALRIQSVGVANGYSYDIANGKRRPSADLALRIFKGTGLKFGPVANLSDEEIALLEKMQG